MRALLLVAALCAGSALAQEGGVGVFSGPTLPEQVGRVSLSYRYDQRSHVRSGDSRSGDPLDRRLRKNLLVAGFDYGLLPQLTLTALVPVSRDELRLRDSRGRMQKVRAYGLGDVAFLAKYRVYKTDWTQSAFNVSLIGGLEFPTGESRQRDDGVLLPRFMQPGSGSWDPFVSLASTISVGRFRADGRVVGKLNTLGPGDVDRGDEVSVQLSAKYRYWHEKYPGPSASVTLGGRWTYQGRTKVDGRTERNSGHQLVFLTPSLGIHPIPRLDLNLGVDIPLYQRYRGTQLARDLRVTLAFGIRF